MSILITVAGCAALPFAVIWVSSNERRNVKASAPQAGL
jgi:hypothetical protein